jgi:hypothetical protein
MAISHIRCRRALMLTSAVVVTVWGSVGLYQGLNTGFSGGLYDPEYRIPAVRRGGLADKSGFKPGDRVISVQGRPVEELGMESRWPRSLIPRIGESRRFVVDRNGERIPVDVVFPAPFAAAVNNRISTSLVGLAFLGCGLWAFLTVQNCHARTLAHIGLAAGVAASLGLGPPLGSLWNGVQGHISTAANALMFILMLRFFVTFPTSKAVSQSRTAARLVYGTWGCLLVFLLTELVTHPVFYYTTGTVAGPLTLAYGILILAAIAHTLLKGRRAEMRECGMYWILGGFMVAIAGTASASVLPLNLPGWTYATFTAAIPLSMALAVRRYGRRAVASLQSLS